jgi:hypothetical protein
MCCYVRQKYEPNFFFVLLLLQDEHSFTAVNVVKTDAKKATQTHRGSVCIEAGACSVLQPYFSLRTMVGSCSPHSSFNPMHQSDKRSVHNVPFVRLNLFDHDCFACVYTSGS